jgi:2-methylcitrate dehydratase PrpD
LLQKILMDPASPSPATTLTQRFAAHWSRVQFEELPAGWVHEAKRRVLDTIAAGLAGTGSLEATCAARAALRLQPEGAAGTAALWGTHARANPALAALVNGTAAHARELDDFDGCGHTGAVVVPAVCALAQQVHADGRTVIVAVLAGYDLAGRMLDAAGGYRPHNGRGWHSTATCGSFGAAAAAARVLQLDADRFAAAVGIAGTYVGGTWAFMEDGAMTKRLHPGKAAESGVTAACLAEAGMTGPTRILEAQWGGFFSTYCGEHARPELLLHELGERNAISATGIKPYACCRGSHAAIDALLQLQREHDLRCSDIQRLVVHCAPHTARLVGSHRVDNVLDAQMSLPYALAVTAASGRADLPQFDPPRHSEPGIARLMAVTEVLGDLPADHAQGPLLEVHLEGRTLRAQVGVAKGHPSLPVSDQELHAKSQSLIEPLLGAERFARIAQTVDRLEELPDFNQLADLLTPA